jgi:ureidoacrylate peracid hydrolase
MLSQLEKLTCQHLPKGTWDGKVIDEIVPNHNEIWLPKNSSSVFISNHIDYILRNLGIRHLVNYGVITDQCVESAVRDAAQLIARQDTTIRYRKSVVIVVSAPRKSC